MPIPTVSLNALLGLTLCLVALSARAQTKREIDLRPRFEKGQEIRYEMRTNATDESGFTPRLLEALDSAERPSRPSRTHTQQTMRLLLRVLESDPESGSTLEMIIESVSVTIESSDGRVAYDSAAPPKRPPPTTREPTEEEMQVRALQAAVDLMVGSKVTIRMDPTGTVTALNIPASLDQTAVPAVLSGTPAGSAPSHASTVGVPLDQIVSHGHPTGLVKRGEEWTNKDIISGLGVSLRTHHKLRSSTAKSASVDIAGVLTPESERAQILQADYEGAYTWDTERGQLLKMDLRANVQIDTGIMKHTRAMKTGVRRTE